MAECVVCGRERQQKQHLGVNACRACAEFFSRMKLSGKQLVCRLGGGHCSQRNQSASTMCRFCRMKKCKAVGMKLIEPVRLAVATQETRSSVYSSELQDLADAYQKFCERRVRAELSLRNSSRSKLIPANEKFIITNVAFAADCYILLLGAIDTFIGNFFPSVSCDSMTSMRKNFLVLLIAYERFSLLQKYFAGCSRYMPISMTICIDLESPETFFDGCHSKTEDKIHAFRQMKYYNCKKNDMISNMLMNAQLSCVEEAALLALFMFTPAHDSNDEVLEMAEKRRAKIFSQLHTYYRQSLGLEKYSQRLGNLCILRAAIQESCALDLEELHTYRLLNVYADEYIENYMTYFFQPPTPRE